MVVKEGTGITLEPDCRIARGGYLGGGGRRRAVCGRVPLALWKVAWVPRDLSPDCRNVRVGYRVGGGRRRAVGGRLTRTLWNAAWVPREVRSDCRVGAAAFCGLGSAAARSRAVVASAHARAAGVVCVVKDEELTMQSSRRRNRLLAQTGHSRRRGLLRRWTSEAVADRGRALRWKGRICLGICLELI